MCFCLQNLADADADAYADADVDADGLADADVDADAVHELGRQAFINVQNKKQALAN